MKRRQMIAAFGAAAATLPVLASARAASSAPTPKEKPGEATAKAETAKQPASTPASSDQETWMKMTMAIGSMSLLASRAAVDDARNAAVKQFAKWEVYEQETLADVLTSMQDSAPAPQGKLQPPSDAEARNHLDAKMKDQLSELKQKKDAAFDKAYIQAQLTGHKKLLTVQVNFLKVGQNRESLDVAKIARAYIEQHIDQLQALQSKIG
ncbi:DUF4142 domain-containing protein [Pararhizobium mangrovi]|uniref:DUF4142 domain-containing protein n=1 Tax=Pararhizobium mangrovi TaxID=2590452 RepID=A0A506UHN9_9HYPH|nr:DUF4142 domain-containing protein [Pararhizobium mangrovi]TPW32826.1 DUF4142 domain-containing protein [Pararhizobium mangrovi]